LGLLASWCDESICPLQVSAAFFPPPSIKTFGQTVSKWIVLEENVFLSNKNLHLNYIVVKAE
jgi:hypothetical protein